MRHGGFDLPRNPRAGPEERACYDEDSFIIPAIQ
jgi:hypothetical protein